MATILDVSILSHFSTIFTFLLVFVIVFGMLELFKFLGDDKRSLHAIIALCIGFLVIFSSGTVKLIQAFTPWFFVIILLIFLLIFAARMFGLSEKQVTEAFYNQPYMVWILILTVVILLFSLGGAFGQQSLEKGGNNETVQVSGNTTIGEPGSTSTSSFSQNVYNTLYHPKMLGLILVMLVAVIAALLLTIKEGP
jgi:hypothetical protein